MAELASRDQRRVSQSIRCTVSERNWPDVEGLRTAWIEVTQKFGKEHTVLTKEETDEFRSKLEPVVERWISDVSKSGVDRKVLVSKAHKLIAKHSQQ